jgi:jumonji domain-containing protein 7
MFVMPDTQRMSFKTFLDRSATETSAFYISHQNNSLREESEFGECLIKDVETELPFASEAFGCPPDAVNFWLCI